MAWDIGKRSDQRPNFQDPRMAAEINAKMQAEMATCAIESVRMSRVSMEIDGLLGGLDELRGGINFLRERLNPVLTPQVPTAANSHADQCGFPVEMKGDVALALGELRVRVRDLSEVLADVIERLEV